MEFKKMNAHSDKDQEVPAISEGADLEELGSAVEQGQEEAEEIVTFHVKKPEFNFNNIESDAYEIGIAKNDLESVQDVINLIGEEYSRGIHKVTEKVKEMIQNAQVQSELNEAAEWHKKALAQLEKQQMHMLQDCYNWMDEITEKFEQHFALADSSNVNEELPIDNSSDVDDKQVESTQNIQSADMEDTNETSANQEKNNNEQVLDQLHVDKVSDEEYTQELFEQDIEILNKLPYANLNNEDMLDTIRKQISEVTAKRERAAMLEVQSTIVNEEYGNMNERDVQGNDRAEEVEEEIAAIEKAHHEKMKKMEQNFGNMLREFTSKTNVQINKEPETYRDVKDIDLQFTSVPDSQYTRELFEEDIAKLKKWFDSNSYEDPNLTEKKSEQGMKYMQDISNKYQRYLKSAM